MSCVFVRLLMLQWICTMCFVTPETVVHAQNLIKKLFKSDGYNKILRPLMDQFGNVTVQTDMVLNSIIEFNEQEESMKISGYLYMSWWDELLTWNPEEYGGLDRLQLPQNDVWRPDVALHNSFRTFTGLGSSNLLLTVDNNGLVVWMPYQVSTTADVDGKEAVVIFKMKLKRKSIFYVFHILIPMVLLSFLNVLTFALPVSSGERAAYAITVFLSLAVFLTIVASEIPKNSNTVSIISIYMTAMIALSTAAVITSLIESRLASRDKYTDSIGSGYTTLYRLARICQCKRGGKSHPTLEIEWEDVVAALDYFLFWLFFVLTFVATVVLFVIANKQ